MSIDLNLLNPDFKLKLQALLEVCHERKVEMTPYYGIRTPIEQAKLWRQSRTSEEIQKAIKELKSAGAEYLATCLEIVGPQNGRHVTNALPGNSWHQWGEAIDCYWLVNNKAIWETNYLKNGINGYQVYASEAKKMGLEAGLFWNNFPDAGHVQLRRASSPSKVYSMKEIDEAVHLKFGDISDMLLIK